MKLTDEQVLSVLNLNETYPEVIWFTGVQSTGIHGREKLITIHPKNEVSQPKAEEIIRSIFPDASFHVFYACDWAFDIRWQGENIGTLFMTKENPPAATEGKKDSQSDYTTARV